MSSPPVPAAKQGRRKKPFGTRPGGANSQEADLGQYLGSEHRVLGVEATFSGVDLADDRSCVREPVAGFCERLAARDYSELVF